jgi:hypothetical protein
MFNMSYNNLDAIYDEQDANGRIKYITPWRYAGFRERYKNNLSIKLTYYGIDKAIYAITHWGSAILTVDRNDIITYRTDAMYGQTTRQSVTEVYGPCSFFRPTNTESGVYAVQTNQGLVNPLGTHSLSVDQQGNYISGGSIIHTVNVMSKDEKRRRREINKRIKKITPEAKLELMLNPDAEYSYEHKQGSYSLDALENYTDAELIRIKTFRLKQGTYINMRKECDLKGKVIPNSIPKIITNPEEK